MPVTMPGGADPGGTGPLLTERDVGSSARTQPGNRCQFQAHPRLPKVAQGNPTQRSEPGHPGCTSHVNTGNMLLVSEDQCSVRDKRWFQPRQATSYLGLPEEAMSGLGHDELLARPRIGLAYPAEASAGVPAGRAGRAGLCAVGTAIGPGGTGIDAFAGDQGTTPAKPSPQQLASIDRNLKLETIYIN
jgi:hypothetical protein